MEGGQRRIVLSIAGGVETYEPLPDDPQRWQQIHGPTRLPIDDPIAAEELLERVKAVIAGIRREHD